MSIKVMSLILEGGAAYRTPTHKLCMICIADHADDYGYAYPSMLRLARKIGLTGKDENKRRTVRRLVQDMIEDGMLTAKKQGAVHPSGDPAQTNLFHILPPAWTEPPSTPLYPGEMGGGSQTPGGVGGPRGEGFTDPPNHQLNHHSFSSSKEDGSSGNDTLTPLLVSQDEQQKHEENRSRRQRFAIDRNVQDSARKKLKAMLADHYEFARELVNKHGYKDETLYTRLSSNPATLSRFKSLNRDTFDRLIEVAKQAASQHTSGWEAMVGPQFLHALNATSGASNNAGQELLVNQLNPFPAGTAEANRLNDYRRRVDQAKRVIEVQRASATPNERIIAVQQDTITELEAKIHELLGK